MTSTVTCRTRPESTLSDVFAALFPCGSITGAPKRAAMQAICNLEGAPRGIYCGALGIVRPGGHATFSVAIRTVLVQGAEASCGIGSGVTLDSSAPGEWDEWAVKRRFLWRASAPFDLLETLLMADGAFGRRERHVDRMLGSARHFGFPLTCVAINDALAILAQKHPGGRFRIRLLADRDGRVRAEAFALESPSPPLELRVRLAGSPIDSDPLLPPDLLAHKTTQRNHYPALDEGVDDLLLWTRAGRVTEFTRGNLVYQWLGQRCTPPADGTLLPGVLRADLLDRGAIVERPLRVDELPHCEGLWFINSLRGEIAAQLG